MSSDNGDDTSASSVSSLAELPPCSCRGCKLPEPLDWSCLEQPLDERVLAAVAWVASLGRSIDHFLKLDDESLWSLAIYLDPWDPVTTRLIGHRVANVSGEDFELRISGIQLLRAFLQVPEAQDEVLRQLIRNNRPIREIIFELLSIDLATGLEWFRDVAETESVEWLGSYCDLLEWILGLPLTVAPLHGQTQERPPESQGHQCPPPSSLPPTDPAPDASCSSSCPPAPPTLKTSITLEEPTNAHWLHLVGMVIAHRSPPDLADRAYLLLEKTATMVPWGMRSIWAKRTYAAILTRECSSEHARDSKIRSFARLIRGGQLKMDSSSGYRLRLIFFAHHGIGIIRLAEVPSRCPEARELVASVVFATCQLTQRGHGVDIGVLQNTEERHTADDQSVPLDPSERRLLYKSVLKTLNKIIQVNGRQSRMMSLFLRIADADSGAQFE
ncbi:hypothetical protein EHS25_002064 [Saitozyma podzolica]|uniref:Uncharacterized protein n=1 Tax=Saitozyma podzolica TaxID=1890683 RepID=A0A427YEZ1_9TREE|nr:hypothetical protein EHS25_002064 [Saitozyma podzolica]